MKECMFMKKSATILLTTAIILFVTACSSNQISISENNSPTVSNNSIATEASDTDGSLPEATVTEATESSSEIVEITESIALTDAQKEVVTFYHEEITRMTALLFNYNYEVKDGTDSFKGTPYECERFFAPENEITDAGYFERFPDYECPFVIKYTGDKVNTVEKLQALRDEYFTEKMQSDWIERKSGFYCWEEGGCAFQTSGEGGPVAILADWPDVYVSAYEEIEAEIRITFFEDYTNIAPDMGMGYKYITLAKEDGKYKLDRVVSQNGDPCWPSKVYQKGTLHI